MVPRHVTALIVVARDYRYFTATEAAAFAVIYAFIVTFFITEKRL